MKESSMERKFREAIQKLGCIVVKFQDPAHVGAPDRMILTPHGRALFLEFKKPGKEPDPHQIKYMDRLHKMGYPVGWVDDFDRAVLWVMKFLPGIGG